ncbi:hypothetical protein D9613_010093 [Agrocybe pediades]|uniref:Uncharacterized protein n=1 Tax=Agrocybe pediades TaxID=84607 RepID=A0A8H4QXQ9_9AGAR|nr:hypothetical protein D9613_010093 [Agrocybe pediades]
MSQPAPSSSSTRASTLFTVLVTKYYGIRNVSYWVTTDNGAALDGDIFYPRTVDDLPAPEYTGQQEGTKVSGAFSILRGSRTWPNAIISYKYPDAATQRLLEPIVNQTIGEWKRAAPYLNFQRLSNNPNDMVGS